MVLMCSARRPVHEMNRFTAGKESFKEGPLLFSPPNKRPSLRIFRTLPANEHGLPAVIHIALRLHGLAAAYGAA